MFPRPKHFELGTRRHGEYAASEEAYPAQCAPQRRSTAPASSCIRTFVKKVESALEAGDKAAAAAALAAAQPEMVRGVAKGVLHKNTASRKFARLNKRVEALA